jgi:hypothetical protein
MSAHLTALTCWHGADRRNNLHRDICAALKRGNLNPLSRLEPTQPIARRHTYALNRAGAGLYKRG